MNIIFNKLNFTVTVYVFIKLKVMFSPLRLVIRFTDFLRTPPSPGTPTPRRSVSRQETSDLLHPCCQVNKPCCQVNKTCCQANKNLFFKKKNFIFFLMDIHNLCIVFISFFLKCLSLSFPVKNWIVLLVNE